MVAEGVPVFEKLQKSGISVFEKSFQSAEDGFNPNLIW